MCFNSIFFSLFTREVRKLLPYFNLMMMATIFFFLFLVKLRMFLLWLHCSYLVEFIVIWNNIQMVVFSKERILFLITGMIYFHYNLLSLLKELFMDDIIFTVTAGYQLAVQMQIYWVLVFFVAHPLTIILHDSDALIAECLF